MEQKLSANLLISAICLFKSDMQQEFDIKEVKPGMFISDVLMQSGTIKIKSQGLIRSEGAINALKSKGVSRVLVDLSKSQTDASINEVKPETIENTNVEAEVQKESPRNKATFDQEINRASAIYTEAREIQHQTFDNMKAGKAIESEAIQRVTGDIIDSVFKNQDALACMTRMRSKNNYLMEHSVNCSILITIFAKYLKLEEDVIEQLAVGAMLADLGMIAISNDILQKDSPLSESEFNQVKSHVNLGLKVLRKSGDISDIALDIVENHHERVDGAGYPIGKEGSELSLYAKMFTIVDAYDALTSERDFMPSKTPMGAFKILRSESSSHFDEELVNEFINCMGIHPVGTLVRLKSNKLGIVIKANPSLPLSPKVNVFYSVTGKCYITPKIINLANNNADEIERSVRPEDFKIDMLKFFKQVLLDN